MKLVEEAHAPATDELVHADRLIESLVEENEAKSARIAALEAQVQRLSVAQAA